MSHKHLNNLGTASKIWGLLTRTERHSALILLGLMFIGMLLETLGVGLVIPAFALLTQSDISHHYSSFQPILQSLGNPSQQTLVILGMLVLVSVYLIKTLFLAFLAWIQNRFAFDVQSQLSHRLFTVYLRQPYTFHLQRNSAQLIRNVISEVSQFASGGIIPGMLLITESLVLLGLCSLLIFVEPKGALFVVIVLSVASWGFYQLTRKRLLRWGEERLRHEGLRVQHLQQGLGSAKDIKVLGRETEFLERFKTHNMLSARMGHLQSTLQQFPRLWLELLAVSGLAILVISMVLQGRSFEVVVPTMALFAAAAFRLMPSVNRVLSSVQAIRYSLPTIEILYAEINLTIPENTSSHYPDVHFRKELELRHITYTYPDAVEPALKDVSLTIRQGESIGFIGSSGAGKSTLVDILLGLLTPDIGNIQIDGVDIQTNLRNWQIQIGYVPQSIYLTDDTLRCNVAFGLPEEQIDENAVRRAIQAAQLEELVSTLPEGLETVVGERGIRLSGGQRQRIGIARALYHDPAVLVLDEATSALDGTTERGVMEAVTALHGCKTIIVIAHRLSTVEHCDRLFRLERGNVIGEGTPEEILSLP